MNLTMNIAESEDSRFFEAFGLYEFIHIRSHVLVMVFGKTRIRTLSTRIDSIDHITGLGKLAMGGFKVIVASSVSMEKNHRLTCALGCIEKTDAIYFDGVGIALI